MKYIFALAILFSGITLQAQTLGFMGKRAMLNIGLSQPNSLFDFWIPSSVEYLSEEYNPKIRLSISGEYLLSKKYSAGVSVSLLTVDANEVISEYYNRNEITQALTKVKTQHYKLFIRNYLGVNKGYKAPLGGYIGGSLGLIRHKVHTLTTTTDNFSPMEIYDYEIYDKLLERNDKPYYTNNIPTLALEFGRNWMIKSPVYIGYQARIQLMLGYPKFDLPDEGIYAVSNYPPDFIFLHNFYYLEICIGALLF